VGDRPPARQSPRRYSDEDVLGLRGRGLSFAAIAGRLGLNRSKDAFEAFHRALGAGDEAERREVIRQELDRLTSLEARIRSRDAAEPEKLEHRLRALEQMRLRLQKPPGSGSAGG
jgi:hypothetical protein